MTQDTNTASAAAARFTKKPVTITASQWFKPGDHPMVEQYDPEKAGAYIKGPGPYGWIKTLEGGHIVSPGDWIITGVAGEHYPCKPDIFAATYSRAALASAPAQPALHPTTGEPMGTDAQEATAWRLAAENLQRENAALRDALKKSNSQAEHFEREWYLRGDALEALAGTAPASKEKEKEYAELPKNRCVIDTYMLSEDDARAFADATHALRTASRGQAPAEFSQFLSDVMTAAGLVTHGKQCKDLGVRLGDMCSRLRADQGLAMGRVPLTRQQLREAFYNDTACTLGGDVDFAEKVCRVVEKAHGIKQGGQHDE